MDTANENEIPEARPRQAAFCCLTVLSREDHQAPQAEVHARVTSAG